MRRIFFLSIILIAMLLTSSCGIVYQSQSRTINDKLMQLNVGMLRDEVLSILGKPDRREVYGESEFLIYITNYKAYYEKERATPILIKSGKVVGWGRNYYDDSIKSKIDADIKINNQ